MLCLSQLALTHPHLHRHCPRSLFSRYLFCYASSSYPNWRVHNTWAEPKYSIYNACIFVLLQKSRLKLLIVIFSENRYGCSSVVCYGCPITAGTSRTSPWPRGFTVTFYPTTTMRSAVISCSVFAEKNLFFSAFVEFHTFMWNIHVCILHCFNVSEVHCCFACFVAGITCLQLWKLMFLVRLRADYICRCYSVSEITHLHV